jgi:hypothetical protein
LMRNQLLAHCIQNDPKNQYKQVHFGVMYHTDNKKLMNMSRPFNGDRDPRRAWRRLLREPGTFHAFTIQQFLDAIETELPENLLEWRKYLKEKYLL